jgi:hypothetical protein
MTFIPNRYDLNFSKANTTAKKFIFSSIVIALHYIRHAGSICDNMQILPYSLPKHNSYCIVTPSHIISKGSSQFGGWMIEADVTRLFSSSWAYLHARSNTKFTSLANNLHKGAVIFEKSLIKRQ